MKIAKKPCGAYGTNCYVLRSADGDIVIDPGDGAVAWIKEQGFKPIAILLTHGHFDHTFDAAVLKEMSGAPILCPAADAFMCEGDPFGLLKRSFTPDILVNDGDKIAYGGVDFSYHIYPGHTPGCAVISFKSSVEASFLARSGDGDDEIWLCGDFLFKGSVGRYDFPYSDAKLMRQSLNRVLENRADALLLPGHGEPSRLDDERENIRWMMRQI